jgi:hypothetical protein
LAAEREGHDRFCLSLVRSLCWRLQAPALFKNPCRVLPRSVVAISRRTSSSNCRAAQCALEVPASWEKVGRALRALRKPGAGLVGYHQRIEERLVDSGALITLPASFRPWAHAPRSPTYAYNHGDRARQVAP